MNTDFSCCVWYETSASESSGLINDYVVHTVKASTLKKGEKCVFPPTPGERPYVYVVTEVHKSGVDVVCIDNGKDFTFGNAVRVVPVHVDLTVNPIKEVIVHDTRRKNKEG